MSVISFSFSFNTSHLILTHVISKRNKCFDDCDNKSNISTITCNTVLLSIIYCPCPPPPKKRFIYFNNKFNRKNEKWSSELVLLWGREWFDVMYRELQRVIMWFCLCLQKEYALPEQYKSTWGGKAFTTQPTDIACWGPPCPHHTTSFKQITQGYQAK